MIHDGSQKCIFPGRIFGSFKALKATHTEDLANMDREVWKFECRCGEVAPGYTELRRGNVRIKCHRCGESYHGTGGDYPGDDCKEGSVQTTNGRTVLQRRTCGEEPTTLDNHNMAQPMNSAQKAEYIRELEDKRKSEEELNTPVRGAVASDLDRPNILVQFDYDGGVC